MSNEDNVVKKYIYIIRNYINNKVYVGQAIDPEKRFKGHIWHSKDRIESAIDSAIKKYGKDNFYYEILEEATEDFNEREKYWINFFNCVSPNGYNILEGGQNPPVRSGFKNNKCKFNEDDINEIIKLLSNPRLSLKEIASYFNVVPKTISYINKGKTYHQDNVEYPIRNFNHTGSFKNMLDEETVSKIIEDLKNSSLSFREIALKYNTSHNQVMSINKGNSQLYYRDNIEYPITDKCIKLKNEDVISIKEYLKNGILDKHKIAEKYNVNIGAIQGINSGRTYFDENEIYPLRKSDFQYDFDEEIYENIRKMLKEGCKPEDIASILNLPKTSLVYDINKGKTHRSENYSYPIQKFENKINKKILENVTYELVETNKPMSQIAKENDIGKTSVVLIKDGVYENYRLPHYTYPLRPKKFKYKRKCTKKK